MTNVQEVNIEFPFKIKEKFFRSSVEFSVLRESDFDLVTSDESYKYIRKNDSKKFIEFIFNKSLEPSGLEYVLSSINLNGKLYHMINSEIIFFYASSFQGGPGSSVYIENSNINEPIFMDNNELSKDYNCIIDFENSLLILSLVKYL